MGPSIEIDFRGMPPAQHVRDTIAKHLNELETRFGGITGGNVVLMSPGAHHRSGGPYEVTILCCYPTGTKSMSAEPARPTSGMSFTANSTLAPHPILQLPARALESATERPPRVADRPCPPREP